MNSNEAMNGALGETLSLLVRTPATLDALLADLPPRLLNHPEGPGKWSPRDVLGHLIRAERTNWPVRVRHILSANPQPFAPFIREGHPMGDPDLATTDLLATFSRLRSGNLEVLRGLDLGASDLTRTGIHPEFGQVTLAQLIATWGVHDLTHIAQIVRTLAKAHRAEVGPWSAYLSILRERQ